MNRLRVLLLAPDADPTRVSIPYVTYCHAAALAELHDVSVVIGSPVEESVRRANAHFHSIEVVRMSFLNRLFDWCFRTFLHNNFDTQWLTALMLPFSLAFEWLAWRQLRSRIFAGEFDVVLRILPMAATLPSPFSFFLRNGPIPFVIGPITGGLPWPPGFSQVENQREWVSNLRNLYRYAPFARSTYRNATAIIAASSQTCGEFARFRDKLFFVPEPGIGTALCSDDQRHPEPDAKLELIFVGGLVPRKACDLALRAAATLLRSDLAYFTVIGDGPERNNLEQLVKTLSIEKAVVFTGWLSHAEVLGRLRSADVMVFPSVRDNGAGIIFESLATGAVPVVADFGGPGDIVRPDVGYKVPLTNENDVVAQIEKILTELVNNREHLEQLRRQAIVYARERLTWDAKAQDTTQVLRWVVGQGPKPDLPSPKALAVDTGSSRKPVASHAGDAVAR
jgi:glycosyltransferase involved in cell wall biosynthesis